MGLDVVTTYAGIDPDAIPGRDLQPDDLDRLATDLVGSSRALRAGGAELVDRWRGLSAVYEAPEAPALLDGILPVEPAAARYADALAQVASAVREYAETIRPLQRTLSGLRDDARSFRTRAAARERWDGDQGLVDENTRLVHAVGVQQSLLDEAARQCALRIRAATRGDSALRECTPDGLHLSRATTLPADDQPWGHVVRRHDPCPKSAAVQVKHFLWDGIAVDNVWGGVVGAAGLVGFDESWHHDWSYAAASFTAMGGLFRTDSIGSDARYETAKSTVAWDLWKDDPARAAGTVAMFLLPGLGPAGALLKGARATAAMSRTSAVLHDAAMPARILPAARTSLAMDDVASASRTVTEADAPFPGDFTLALLSDGTYRSPAGLIFGPDPDTRFDSRVDHVLNHAADAPTRPGAHGVFTADPLRTTDEAWGAVLRGDAVVQVQGRRRVFYVNMHRDVGFVGGQSGVASGNPSVSYIKLVTVGDHVISAYPVAGIPMGR
ncbi:hypothetical protein GXP71_02995 [Cellulomonas sp. H30R-01]|uniref:hypothetical protein n=1 Tax=Cellulomonas sp. H30R-01 TaxID=2704467 RepID=UPI00138BC1B1|nr:hypothetical protein [Cellulomonas sp. H30R-01]QHT55157.1 hypothetical protein GXP71_02995 [Cellulomonas sp. H30R-01]